MDVNKLCIFVVAELLCFPFFHEIQQHLELEGSSPSIVGCDKFGNIRTLSSPVNISVGRHNQVSSSGYDKLQKVMIANDNIEPFIVVMNNSGIAFAVHVDVHDVVIFHPNAVEGAFIHQILKPIINDEIQKKVVVHQKSLPISLFCDRHGLVPWYFTRKAEDGSTKSNCFDAVLYTWCVLLQSMSRVHNQNRGNAVLFDELLNVQPNGIDISRGSLVLLKFICGKPTIFHNTFLQVAAISAADPKEMFYEDDVQDPAEKQVKYADGHIDSFPYGENFNRARSRMHNSLADIFKNASVRAECGKMLDSNQAVKEMMRRKRPADVEMEIENEMFKNKTNEDIMLAEVATLVEMKENSKKLRENSATLRQAVVDLTTNEEDNLIALHPQESPRYAELPSPLRRELPVDYRALNEKVYCITAWNDEGAQNPKQLSQQARKRWWSYVVRSKNVVAGTYSISVTDSMNSIDKTFIVLDIIGAKYEEYSRDQFTAEAASILSRHQYLASPDELLQSIVRFAHDEVPMKVQMPGPHKNQLAVIDDRHFELYTFRYFGDQKADMLDGNDYTLIRCQMKIRLLNEFKACRDWAQHDSKMRSCTPTQFVERSQEIANIRKTRLESLSAAMLNKRPMILMRPCRIVYIVENDSDEYTPKKKRLGTTGVPSCQVSLVKKFV